MKHLVLFTYLLFMSALGQAAGKIKVACVGNSVTYGYGIPDRERKCYPSVLQQRLGAGYEVKNFGHSGTTLLNQGHRPYREQTEYRDALAFKADLVVIHLGLNDTDPRNWPNYNSLFDKDYQQLIGSFRAANPNAKIWICLMSPIFDRHLRFESGTRDWHAAIQQHIQRIARANGTGLIDLYTPLHKRPDLFADAIHPNAEGAGIIAQTVYAAITGDYGGLRLPPLYGDGMVMQRRQPLVFRGTANAGEKVDVAFNGRRQTATTGPDGRWETAFPAMKAGGPYEARIATKSKKRNIRDIYIGEVWLCSGQSNMELPVRATTSADDDLAQAGRQQRLRLFNMPTLYPTDAVEWPRETLDSVNRLKLLQLGPWRKADRESVEGFSSIAYHFGRTLADSLRIPVGIICNAVGGTTTESWIDRRTLEWDFPVILRDWYDSDFGQAWARGRALLNIANADSFAIQRHPYEPAYMFEAGMLPLRGYDVKGVAWYQGESNAHNMELHERLFRLLQKSWRGFFHQPDMPFLFVQLSGLNRPSWPEFRNSQRRLAAEMPHTWMTVSMDMGDSLDVHYRNKRPVGERLARQALGHVYGHALICESPACTKAVGDGREVRLSFDNAVGLKVQGTSLIGFEVAGEDGVYHAAAARVTGNDVTLSSPQVARPAFVRYGWQPYSRANLVNAAGLPCSTFVKEIAP